MTYTTDPKVRQLQLTELEITKKIMELVRENGLRCYMLGGTLLGAVRHKGFIPWDDDMDLGMPRRDYERFLVLAADRLSEPYAVETAQDGTGHYPYARVVDRSVELLRTVGMRDEIIHAWVDVFPLDGVPADGLRRRLWRFHGTYLFNLLKLADFSYFAKRTEDGRQSFLRRVVRAVFTRVPLERVMRPRRAALRLDRALRRYDFDTRDTVCNFMGFWREKETFPRRVYDESAVYPFEDIELPGPGDYDYVLTQMYGDYMTPPPESERDHHGTTLLGRADDENREAVL